ncbi:MAG TPA: glycosyltransferase 87 family protein [Propionibacteriaceae bacterium]|nr:glycosyltransferase 87 family protein [Propionibacteriaceae bacterium]
MTAPTATVPARESADQGTWSEMMLRRLGGPLGRHAASRMVLGPAVILVLATLSWLLLMAHQTSCRQTDPTASVNAIARLCYTDIPVLYQARGLSEGRVPYITAQWEYPVLTGGFVDVARRLTDLLGVHASPNLTGQQVLTNADIFYSVCSVMLFACFLALVLLQLHMGGRRWWATSLMVAVAPVVLAEGLINWDIFAVTLTAAALFAWGRRRPYLAGFFYGLAVAAKLYPLFILGPLLLLCLRSRRLRAFGQQLGAAVVTWVLVNLPVFVASPSGWMYFWQFNVDRGADLGSIWYVMSLAGLPLPNPGAWSLLFMMLGCLGIGALVFLAPRRPRVAQVAFLVVALFLLVNKVYSPQYALWLLPLLALARPTWREWALFNVAEVAYYFAIWGHLAGTLHPGDGGPDRLYWLAVFLRMGVSIWLMVVVVNDILNPEEDPVREDGVDDPIGGVLDRAPEGWSLRLVSSGEETPALRHAPSGSVVYGPVEGADDRPAGSPRRALVDDLLDDGPDQPQ